ncbi:MAG TPA: LLM class flavin-dependent oxidoreductase [Candidatus Dormibacteraeota bacterium]|nr:LLM class flavin-dependent oxidoreductase [Candidatus Dormibacteraeota bacterium]
MNLSVLDIVPVFADATAEDALQTTVEVARGVERLGYRRYWVVEHHNTPGVAVSAPAVLIGHLASLTTTLRVGAGGVLLPNHVPLVVAEQFNTLSALHPGRIDLGIGRAPGTDPVTARALRRVPTSEPGEDFARQIRELLDYLRPPDPAPPIRAYPAAGTAPEVWLLGSSPRSARLAGAMGLPFAFAHHFDAEGTEPAVAAYREAFRPSPLAAEPRVMVAVFAVIADTDERADWLAGPAKISVLHLLGGRPAVHVTEETAAAHPYTDFEADLLATRLSRQVVGGPDTARERLGALLASARPDELIALSPVRDAAERIHSYQLLAEAVEAIAGPAVASAPGRIPE